MPISTEPRGTWIDESLIDHDALLNWVANKHIDHSGVSITGAGLLAGQGGDITASRVFTLNNSDIDHDSLSNYVADQHIDWTNASDNFLTNGTLGSGDATINGKVLIDDDDTEVLLVRKDGDVGDLLAIDSSGNNILIGERDTPNLVDIEWRNRFAPGDTTSGVYWNANSNVLHDAIAWRYRATFFGYSAPSPMNYLVEVSPGGFDFKSQFHDNDTNYVNVGLSFHSYDVSDAKVGDWWINCVLSGDLEIRHAYSGSQVLIFDWINKCLKIPDKDIILGTTTGTKIGTATTQKLGFFNATPVTQRLKANYNNWAAFTDIIDALVDLGLFDQA